MTIRLQNRRWLYAGLALLAPPLAHFLHLETNASASVGSFRPDLLVNPFPVAPRLDQLRLLDRPVIANYTVGRNEDLWSICQRFHVDQFSVRSSNDLDTGVLEPGSVIRIPNHKGTLYEVRTPENLQAISQGFNRGKLLGNGFQREILEANDFPRPNLRLKDYAFDTGTVLFLPEAWKPTGLGLPFMDMHFRQTSSFGRRKHPVLGITRAHRGIDLAKPYGSPVLTSREGIVTFTGWMGGYGNMIEIRHVIKRKKGTRVLCTRYGHLSKILVHEGQHVHLYQLIGRVGSSGISTGPHLHFEVRDESGAASNPRKFL